MNQGSGPRVVLGLRLLGLGVQGLRRIQGLVFKTRRKTFGVLGPKLHSFLNCTYPNQYRIPVS